MPHAERHGAAKISSAIMQMIPLQLDSRERSNSSSQAYLAPIIDDLRACGDKGLRGFQERKEPRVFRMGLACPRPVAFLLSSSSFSPPCCLLLIIFIFLSLFPFFACIINRNII